MRSVYTNTPEQQKIAEGYATGKKRTCPQCGEVFLTRKAKRIHRKVAPDCEAPVDLARHKYA